MNNYMYQELSEKLLNSLKINHIRKTMNYIEYDLSKTISREIKVDELFIELYNISESFKISLKFNRLKIKLFIKPETDDWIREIAKSLNVIKSMIESVS